MTHSQSLSLVDILADLSLVVISFQHIYNTTPLVFVFCSRCQMSFVSVPTGLCFGEISLHCSAVDFVLKDIFFFGFVRLLESVYR